MNNTLPVLSLINRYKTSASNPCRWTSNVSAFFGFPLAGKWMNTGAVFSFICNRIHVVCAVYAPQNHLVFWQNILQFQILSCKKDHKYFICCEVSQVNRQILREESSSPGLPKDVYRIDYFLKTIASPHIDTLPHVLKLVACNVLNSRNIMGHMTAMYQTIICMCGFYHGNSIRD